MMILTYALYALAAVVAYYIIDFIITQIGDWKFARDHGCKPPAWEQQSEYIIGVEPVRKVVKASNAGKLLEYFLSKFDRYGETYMSRVMGMTMVNTIDPENVKAMLATQFKDFDLGTREREFGQFLGTGIFVSNGELWEHSRALVRPSFTRAQVADLDSFEGHIQHLLSRIPTDGSTVDLQPLLFRLTLDASTEFLFGESVNSQTAVEGSIHHNFAVAFDQGQLFMAARTRMGHLGRFLYRSEIYRHSVTVHNYVDRVVQDALEYRRQIDAGQLPAEKDGAKYVFLREAAKATTDPLQLRSEVVNILLAGRDTTASLLSNTLHVLVRRRDIWDQLRAEVDTLEGRRPSYDDVKALKYVRNVLHEALRLYAVVPLNARFATRRTTLPRGGGPTGHDPIFVARGRVCSYSVWCMHRRRDVYGPDADTFRPDRWDDLRPGWAYLPFNGGPRICVGQQYALMEAAYFLARFVQLFDFPENRDPSPWRENVSLTLAGQGGVKVALTRRGE